MTTRFGWFRGACSGALLAAVCMAAWAQDAGVPPNGDPPAADQLIGLDGQPVEGRVTAIDAKGQVTLADGKSLALQQLRQIRRPVEPAPNTSARTVVHLVGGGRLLANSATLKNEQCQLTWALGEAPKLPIDAIRGLCLQPEANGIGGTEAFQKALAGSENREDLLFGVIDKSITAVGGLLYEVTDAGAVFAIDGDKQTLPREKVYGLVLTAVGGAGDRTGKALVQLSDGSAVLGQVQSLADGKLSIEVLSGIVLSVPWTAVRDLRVFSDRLTFLSDLEPADAISESIVALPRKWQADKNVDGGPLTLHKRTYEKGLGVQSYSRLDFEPERTAGTFAATVGIDASMGRRGDCEAVVLADGREVFRQRLKGGGESVEVRVPLDRVRRLSLVVEPGEDLDLSDHVNWCDARLIKSGG